MSDNLSVQYSTAVAVTQSDATNDPAGPFAGFEATAGSGTVKVTTIRGDNVSVYCTQGLVKTLAIKRVWSTGTGASLSIVGYKAANDVIA